METIKTPYTHVILNPDNPRTISPESLQLLVQSILEFPRMLEVRPIVVDEAGMILGGNMRYRALGEITKMDKQDIVDALNRLSPSRHKSKAEMDLLLSFWMEWLTAPYLYIVAASTLTEIEKQAFIIKDNLGFGQWDWDRLEAFSQDELQDWGVQTWGSLQPIIAPTTVVAPPSDNVDNHERIIVTFPRERRSEAEQFLRLASPIKTAYKISDLVERSYKGDVSHSEIS